MRAPVLVGAVGVLVGVHASSTLDALRSDDAHRALAVVTLVGVAMAMAVACDAIAGLPWTGKRARLTWAAWIAATVGALWLWPVAVSPTVWPLGALTVYLVIAAVPAALAERVESPAADRIAKRWARLLIGVWLGVSVFAVVRWTLAVRPWIEGVDFYAYVAFARDLARDAREVTLARYHYFPGTFAFWRGARLLAGDSWAAMQWSYLALLAANAVVAAAVVAGATRSPAAGVTTALWYALACVMREGFYGETEPVVTLPILLGLLVWSGAPLTGRSGLWRAAALGVGIGLGVYAKQQGALLTAGWLAIVAANLARPRERRWPWLGPGLVPVAAIATLLALILLEGHGLVPLEIGLSEAQAYEVRAGFIANVRFRGLATDPLWLGGLAALVLWIVLTAHSRSRATEDDARLALVGFAGVAGLTAGLQFVWRAYAHYELLSAPFLVVAVVVAAVSVARRIAALTAAGPLLRFLALGVAAAPLVAWPLSLAQEPSHPLPWRARPDVARDIDALRAVLRPGEDVLVLPPRRNELHLILGTRSRSYERGYWWDQTGSQVRALRSPGLDAVIVIHRLDESDRPVWGRLDSDAAVRALPGAGFSPVAELSTMTVWRRH